MISIVIASMLKPIDEVRMYKRFAISLSKTNKYAINIIGIGSKKTKSPFQNIQFYPYKNSKRSIKNRLIRWYEYAKIIRKIDPDILIVTSPELVLLNSLFFKKRASKWIYDVQEDYYKNITFQSIYPPLIKKPLARLVRWIEEVNIQCYDLLFLAERVYEDSIPFVKKHKKVVLLENKSPTNTERKKKPKRSIQNLLFTGVLSEYSGIHNAITIYRAIKEIQPDITLNIVGYCYQKKVHNNLLTLIKKDPNISWIGQANFVSHDIIVDEIKKADLGVIGYEINEINRAKMPSKLYEYVSLGLPFIVPLNSIWSEDGNAYNLAIPVDFNFLQPENILKRAQKLSTTKLVTNRSNASWNSIESQFLSSIDNLVN